MPPGRDGLALVWCQHLDVHCGDRVAIGAELDPVALARRGGVAKRLREVVL
jgi:hypothetical protein